MFAKLSTFALVTTGSALLSLLLAVAPVAAQTSPPSGYGQGPSQSDQAQGGQAQSSQPQVAQLQPGQSLESAAGPLPGWVTIGPHSSQWYKFKYTYVRHDGDNDDDSKNDPSQALVELKMDTAGCVSFEVWTQDRLNAPPPTEDDDNSEVTRTPVGAGSPIYRGIDHSIDKSSGRDRTVTDPKDLIWVGGAATSNHYYVLVRNRTDATCKYTLAVSGPDVSY